MPLNNPNIAGLVGSYVNGGIAGGSLALKPGTIIAPPPAGLCNIVTGPEPFTSNFGFANFPPFYGSSDNLNPDPPSAGVDALAGIVQQQTLGWVIRFNSVVAQDAWTSCTMTGLETVVLLSAVVVIYIPDISGQSIWIFAPTNDSWNGLGSGQNVTATFA